MSAEYGAICFYMGEEEEEEREKEGGCAYFLLRTRLSVHTLGGVND